MRPSRVKSAARAAIMAARAAVAATAVAVVAAATGEAEAVAAAMAAPTGVADTNAHWQRRCRRMDSRFGVRARSLGGANPFLARARLPGPSRQRRNRSGRYLYRARPR